MTASTEANTSVASGGETGELSNLSKKQQEYELKTKMLSVDVCKVPLLANVPLKVMQTSDAAR